MKKTYILILLLMVAVMSLTACDDSANDSDSDGTVTYTDISAEEAKTLIDSTADIIIIDVSPYYSSGHIPNAVNYPVSSGALDDAIPSLDLSSTFLVYCHADSPAISGAEKLIEAGAEKVYRLIGNYQAWVDAGYDVETD
jgi:rhodanese-related sulfurtransferase